MVWIELMNEHFFEWKSLLDIRHARVLKDKNDMDGLDIAFVEGAITTDADAEKLAEIRSNCKKLVAVGSCAINGMPAAQRNAFGPELKEEIAFLVDRFKQSDRVRKVSEIVKVDDEIEGCPMEEHLFMERLSRYIDEFGVAHASG